MILNHSKTIRSYCAFLLWYLEHSRDITLLIVLLCLFQYFLSMCYVWSLLWLKIPCMCLLTFFVNIIIIMTGEPTHTASKMVPCAPAISIVVWKVRHPLCFVVGCVQPITQQYELRTVQKAPLQSKQLLWKIRTISVTKGSYYVLSQNRHFSLSAKMNGTQRSHW